ncbi:SLC35F4 family protein [Megaselia abdita]
MDVNVSQESVVITPTTQQTTTTNPHQPIRPPTLNMPKEGEIPAIFNPKRVRAPSVVVTGDSPNGPYGGSFTNILNLNTSNSQMTHQDSISSSQQDPNDHMHMQHQHSQDRTYSCVGIEPDTPTDFPDDHDRERFKRLKACRSRCCSEFAQKMYFGICVTILVTASWVGSTHCIKILYRYPVDTEPKASQLLDLSPIYSNETFEDSDAEIKELKFDAPFFISWFFTNFTFFFFPIYILGRVAVRKCDKPAEILGDVLRGFRDRGFTIGRFINRCLVLCVLWIVFSYLLCRSLKILLATESIALFATNVACTYLLSWVILHEQFVGVRIVAVILCDTGIALLAYMDGITGSPTLRGVIYAALAAAVYAIFRVTFRKVLGDPPVGQIAFTFTILGFLNALLLWPVCLGLYLTETETIVSNQTIWAVLFIASILLLVFHILTQFSAAVTYNMFVTLGLITAVPVSGALDIFFNSSTFAGMKLAGLVLICVGFFLVMFPENWPDYITRLLRNIILLGHNASRPAFCRRDLAVVSPATK